MEEEQYRYLLKQSTYKWTHAVQIYVVKGSAVHRLWWRWWLQVCLRLPKVLEHWTTDSEGGEEGGRGGACWEGGITRKDSKETEGKVQSQIFCQRTKYSGVSDVSQDKNPMSVICDLRHLMDLGSWAIFSTSLSLHIFFYKMQIKC